MPDIEGGDIETGIAIARAAFPLYKNRQAFIELVHRFKQLFVGNTPVDVSVYFTMYIYFKSDYPMEYVNESICKILKLRKFKKNRDCITVNETLFAVYYDFLYSDLFYADTENLDDDFSDDDFSDDENEILLPSVKGVSVYLVPNEFGFSDIQNGYKLTEKLKADILKKHNIKQMGSFIYLIGKDNEFSKLKDGLEKIMKPNDTIMKNISQKENEIKIHMDALTTNIVGQYCEKSRKKNS